MPIDHVKLPSSDLDASRAFYSAALAPLGWKLVWDEATETFKGDREANALLSREPRRGYELPNV